MRETLSVTDFVRTVEEGLAAFSGIVVEGEVAEFKIIHGKWVTFQLKDDHSAVGCFMTLWQYKTQIEDGMLIRAQGRPRLRNKGFFSFVIEHLEPVGEGALKRALELLQQKLTAEGLFATEHKRDLPRFPEHIALITSRDAAAYSDFLKVLQARQGGLTISFIHTQVQGADAPRQLTDALATATTAVPGAEVVVMIRGGGSLEDLMAFNDESVVRAVAASRLPIVVGVGHERDVTLAELAADVRASTPSNAAELLVRSRDEVASEIARMRLQLQQRVTDVLVDTRVMVKRVMDILRNKLRTMDRDLSQLRRILTTLSPEQVLKRGYSITRNEDGTVVTSSSQVAAGATVVTQLKEGTINSTIVKG